MPERFFSPFFESFPALLLGAHPDSFPGTSRSPRCSRWRIKSEVNLVHSDVKLTAVVENEQACDI